jgi:hypothetical protein
MKLTSQQLTEIIDTVKESVDNSWLGEVATYGGTPDKPTKQVNQVAFTVYLALLTAIVNKIEGIDGIEPSTPNMFDINNEN